MADQVSLSLSLLFDRDFYLKVYPDISAAGIDPLEHYLKFGWREGRDPSAHFSTRFYLQSYPDVRAAEICPLVHYASAGAIEGRLPTAMPETDPIRARVSDFFDPAFYSAKYPELKGDLLDHYLTYGWVEGRDPSEDFETSFYLEGYPDVRLSGVCPLVHYATTGIYEGRTTKGPRPSVAIINNSRPIREKAKTWKRGFERFPLASEKLKELLYPLSAAAQGLILSFSHDEYGVTWGGIQNCIGDEAHAFQRAGWNYLHLCPAEPIPLLADPQSAAKVLVHVRLNEEAVGIARIADLCSEFRKISEVAVPRYAVLHHLLGFVPELVIELVQSFAPQEVIFWIHDFFSLCPNYNLLRNDTAFCGAPDQNSNACMICSYGSERHSHLSRVMQLFEALSPTVLCPSDSAKEFWTGHARLPFRRAVTVPHGKLQLDLASSADQVDLSRPLRIGFVGTAVYHKGWFVFKSLAARHYGDSRYTFFHVSTEKPSVSRNITHIYARVDAQRRNGVADIVAANNLEVVVSWSLWPETFCFSVHEALAAGAFVVARRAAGDTWPAIEALPERRGCALDTTEELFEFFQSGKLLYTLAPKISGHFQPEASTAIYILGNITK